jgi:hypothetical protein
MSKLVGTIYAAYLRWRAARLNARGLCGVCAAKTEDEPTCNACKALIARILHNWEQEQEQHQA